MHKTLSLLTVAGCTALLGLVPAAPASALGGESLACAVFPSNQQIYRAGGCTNQVASSSYSIDFRVLGGSGSYSYAWTVFQGEVTSGCTSTNADCWVSVPADTPRVKMSVQLTQNGSSEILTAIASIQPYCGGNPC